MKLTVVCSGCGERQEREFYVEGPAMNFTCETCGPLAVDPVAWERPESTRAVIRFYRRGGVRTITGHPRPPV